MIQLTKYKLNNLLLNEHLISQYVTQFWNEIFNSIHSETSPKHLLILVKVHFNDHQLGYRTLGHLVKANYRDWIYLSIIYKND